jgi:hypothetical protein
MYGANILQATDARPTLRTVTPLYQKSVLRGKLNSLLAALTGRSSQLTDIGQLTGSQQVSNQRSLGSKVVRIADIQATGAAPGTAPATSTAASTRWRSTPRAAG